jgi:hypothetical protein
VAEQLEDLKRIAIVPALDEEETVGHVIAAAALVRDR